MNRQRCPAPAASYSGGSKRLQAPCVREAHPPWADTLAPPSFGLGPRKLERLQKAFRLHQEGWELVHRKERRFDEDHDGLCSDLQHDDAESDALTELEGVAVEPCFTRLRRERDERVLLASDRAVELNARESAD